MRLCEPNELFTENMFIRPLVAEAGDKNLIEGWAGEPINRFMWVPITSRLGPHWYGRPISDWLRYGDVYIHSSRDWVTVPTHEVAVDVPESHVDPNCRPLILPKAD
ncbi:hypothetical protein SEA_POKYPUPPY_86 [Gordonia phage PokyPuppy]|nr:hypothetical protein SEA_POKYPUPPY_86 [Gordonia phage PokyPuppy]